MGIMSRYRPAPEKSAAARNEINAKKGVLSAVEVLRIKRGLEAGDRPRNIAEMFGVSEQTITRIRDGKTWSWVKTTDEIMPNGLPARGETYHSLPSTIAQSLMRVQQELGQPNVDPMSEEPSEDAKEAAEAALDERMRLFREGEAMVEELAKMKGEAE
jgi:hypothetical protein